MVELFTSMMSVDRALLDCKVMSVWMPSVNIGIAFPGKSTAHMHIHNADRPYQLDQSNPLPYHAQSHPTTFC